MTVQDITILGAGPCGLSAAIALAKKHAGAQEPPLRITILELRPRLQTIGGTINLTPVATRYIDYLGAGKRLRERAIDLENGLDYISMRSGKRIGNIWGGIGAIRVARHRLVESLLQTIMEEHSDAIRIQWDRRVAEISESESKAVMRFEDGDTLTADVLLGCDGLHSTARRLWVEPERTKTFTGRVITMGWSDQPAGMTLSSGEPALRDTALISSPNGILLSSYYEPTRTKTYLAHIMPMAEPDGGARDGWKAAGEDKAAIRREIVETYQSGQVRGLQEVVSKCEDWHLYPVYVLPAGGRWHRGRVLLLGDAAHAVSDEGILTLQVVHPQRPLY